MVWSFVISCADARRKSNSSRRCLFEPILDTHVLHCGIRIARAERIVFLALLLAEHGANPLRGLIFDGSKTVHLKPLGRGRSAPHFEDLLLVLNKDVLQRGPLSLAEVQV